MTDIIYERGLQFEKDEKDHINALIKLTRWEGDEGLLTVSCSLALLKEEVANGFTYGNARQWSTQRPLYRFGPL